VQQKYTVNLLCESVFKLNSYRSFRREKREKTVINLVDVLNTAAFSA